jgi:transposase-like protein
MKKPKFIDTEWCYNKPQGGYALKEGAPADVQEEFEAYQKVLGEYKKSWGENDMETTKTCPRCNKEYIDTLAISQFHKTYCPDYCPKCRKEYDLRMKMRAESDAGITIISKAKNSADAKKQVEAARAAALKRGKEHLRKYGK